MPDLLSKNGTDPQESASALSQSNPFAGLKPYGEEDSVWFFGRSAEINDLMKRLRRLHFVAVVGASGSGKSSLVRAGLLPQVRDGYLDADWQIATFRPGDRPMANLAEALHSMLSTDSGELSDLLASGSRGLVYALESSGLTDRSRVLLVIDQFEELFQFAQRSNEAATEEVKAFLKLLLAATASDDVPLYVIITMRLEWLNECASYVGWAEAINSGLYLVPQMGRQQFQQAILGPLEMAGGTTTSSLVGRMLNDLDGRSDQLPVLQHALMRLWQRCGATTFDNAAYEAVGTVFHCLSAHAEEVFAELSTREQEVAERIFRSITQIDRNRKVRRPLPLRQIMADRSIGFAEAAAVVEAFARPGRSFLVTTQGALTQDSVIDLSHEALIRQWERLSGWVDNEAELGARLHRLDEDSAEWNRNRKANRSCLYRGSQLDRAEELRPLIGQAGAVVDFLRASAGMRLRTLFYRWGLIAAIFLTLVVVVSHHLRETAEIARMTLVHESEQRRLAEKETQIAQRQAQNAEQYQAFVAHQIDQAKGSATALASIARSIQAPRVYVNYTSSELAAAKSVQSQLEGKGYTVPGLALVTADKAPEQPVLRYFHPEDRDGAARLAGLVQIANAGHVLPQSAPNPKGIIPANQFELWIVPAAAGLARGPAAAAPVATTTAGPVEVKPPTPPAAAAPTVAPTLVASLSAETITAGSGVHLSWSSENSSEVSIENVGRVQPSGSMLLTPSQTGTIRVTATGAGGQVTKSLLLTVVSPPPPAPVNAPAHAAPAVPASSGVKEAITRYQEAYRDESLDELKVAWPSISKSQQKDLKNLFDHYNAIRLDVNCPPTDIHIEGDSASASCTVVSTFTEKGKKQPAQTSPSRFHLRRQEGAWVIESVQ